MEVEHQGLFQESSLPQPDRHLPHAGVRTGTVEPIFINPSLLIGGCSPAKVV